MIGFKPSTNKRTFFDKQIVKDALYVQRVMINSMKRKDGASPEGTPPYAHLGYIKDFIEFWFDLQTRSVVIGPKKVTSRVADNILRALDLGGVSRVNAGTRKRPEIKDATIRARPYTKPAEAAGNKKLDDWWLNAMHKA
jgi:hypothetical protein